MASRGSNVSQSDKIRKFFKEYFKHKFNIQNNDQYKELMDAVEVLLPKDFNSLNYKAPQVRLYNVFFQACKVAKDSQGKKYDCNEQNSNKNNSIQQFFKDHIEFDTSLLGSYVALIQSSRKGMDNFMVSKGSKETISKNTQTFLEAYFQYKWDIKNNDEYKELLAAISILSPGDFNRINNRVVA